MTRSDDNQFCEKNVQFDYGKVTLSSGSATVTTALTSVQAGVASFQSGAIASEGINVSALSGSSVTISVPAGSANQSAVVSYILIGRL